MRMWEFDDSRVVPTSLVLEQDFILRIRRFQRMGTPHLIINVLLSEIPEGYRGRGKLDEAQRRLAAWVDMENGDLAPMTVGDVFIIWPETSDRSDQCAQTALSMILPQGIENEDVEKYTEIYHLPKDYGVLRERATEYVELSKHACSHDDRNSANHLLKSDAARGALTAWSVNQFERLAHEIDLRPYIRTQGIYELIHGRLHLFMEETYMGLDDIRLEHCPHLDMRSPRHLFLDLCQILDRAALTSLTPSFESEDDAVMSVNLSLGTVLGREFAQFALRIPRDKRHKICFEINCGDLLQDFSSTLSAFATLHEEGFQIAIDGISPNMLTYLNFMNFAVDFYKIDVACKRVPVFGDRELDDALKRLPRERIIFFHCDSDQAISAGKKLGITKYQGWQIDDIVSAKKGAEDI